MPGGDAGSGDEVLVALVASLRAELGAACITVLTTGALRRARPEMCPVPDTWPATTALRSSAASTAACSALRLVRTPNADTLKR